MQQPIVAAILIALSSATLAQLPGGAIQRSSNPQGMRIEGDGRAGSASGPVSSATTASTSSAPLSAAGVTRGDSQGQGSTQIQGNSRVTASGVNTNAAAVGKGNTARNTVGSIGGN